MVRSAYTFQFNILHNCCFFQPEYVSGVIRFYDHVPTHHDDNFKLPNFTGLVCNCTR